MGLTPYAFSELAESNALCWSDIRLVCSWVLILKTEKKYKQRLLILLREKGNRYIKNKKV